MTSVWVYGRVVLAFYCCWYGSTGRVIPGLVVFGAGHVAIAMVLEIAWNCRVKSSSMESRAMGVSRGVSSTRVTTLVDYRAQLSNCWSVGLMLLMCWLPIGGMTSPRLSNSRRQQLGDVTTQTCAMTWLWTFSMYQPIVAVAVLFLGKVAQLGNNRAVFDLVFYTNKVSWVGVVMRSVIDGRRLNPGLMHLNDVMYGMELTIRQQCVPTQWL